MKTDWKDYKKNQELSAVCRIVIEKGDDGNGLNKTNYITDTVGYKKVENTLNPVKTKWKYHTNEFQFYDTVE